jgi:excisionase family DNA binding protein
MPSPAPPIFRFLTVPQAAEILNVSVALVYQLVSRREIEHLRVGIGRGTNPSSIPISLLTVEEVAARLGVSVAFVYRMVARREVEHVRVGIGRGKILFHESEIERYPNNLTTDKDRKAEAFQYQNPVGDPGTTISPTSENASASRSLPTLLSGGQANKRSEFSNYDSSLIRLSTYPELGGQRATISHETHVLASQGMTP